MKERNIFPALWEIEYERGKRQSVIQSLSFSVIGRCLVVTVLLLSTTLFSQTLSATADSNVGTLNSALPPQNNPRVLMLEDGSYYQGQLSSASFTRFAADGSTIWSQAFGLVYARPLAGDDGTVYVGSSNGRVYAVTAAGDVLWQTKTLGPILSDLQWGSDRSAIFVVTDNGWLYVLRNRDGQPLWKLDLGFETGATLEGSLRFNPGKNTLYLRDSHNKLYAVRVSEIVSAMSVKTLNQNNSSAPELFWVRSIGE